MEKTSEKLHQINYLTAEIEWLYHQASLRMGIADSTMRVLYTIYDHGEEDCPLSCVYKESGISKQTVNSALRRLEEQGILRVESGSGRGKRVLVTEVGKEYVDRTAGRLYRAECALFASWSDEEIDEHIRLMAKYNEAFRQTLEEL